jgi:hypothetical protein
MPTSSNLYRGLHFFFLSCITVASLVPPPTSKPGPPLWNFMTSPPDDTASCDMSADGEDETGVPHLVSVLVLVLVLVLSLSLSLSLSLFSQPVICGRILFHFSFCPPPSSSLPLPHIYDAFWSHQNFFRLFVGPFSITLHEGQVVIAVGRALKISKRQLSFLPPPFKFSSTAAHLQLVEVKPSFLSVILVLCLSIRIRQIQLKYLKRFRASHFQGGILVKEGLDNSVSPPPFIIYFRRMLRQNDGIIFTTTTSTGKLQIYSIYASRSVQMAWL